MRRRKAIGLTVFGGLAGIPACRENPAPAAVPAPGKAVVSKDKGPPLEGENLVPVRVEEDLVIRTIAGLRPYRPSGFVVRREDVSGKILVHNYGHGGGGMSLSWGSAQLAVNLAGPLAGVDCAVIGAGVMGLSVARLLQSRGAKVTLHTRDLPGETVSQVSGAQWWPFSVFHDSRRTEAFGAQYVEAARFAYEYFQTFAGPEWGVSWLPNYYLSGGPPQNGWIGGPGGVLHSLQVDFQDFAPGEHVFSTGWARRFYSMLIEPSVYLPRLLQEIRNHGAEVRITPFSTAQEILALPQPVIFNCTGLGAGPLFDDRELTPIKGQLTFLLPQPDVKYNLISGDCYMFPRTDGILLGGTYEHGQWDTTPDPAAKSRILSQQRALFQKMAELQPAARSGRSIS